MRLLAERIIASEKLAYKKSGQTQGPIVADVCTKLRPILGMLIGNGGYRVLLLRSLALATVEAPILKAASITDDGALILRSNSTSSDQKKLNEGSVVLVAHLLGLLNAFIGEALTEQFMREAWPRVSFRNSPNFETTGKK